MTKAPNAPLTDRYHRRLSYLRVSVTDRCNFRCIYCNPRGSFKKLHHREILTFEEILRVVRAGVSLGIKKVRITGGEPLVRKGVYEFLCRLREIRGLEDISLTTNGSLLGNNIDRLRAAGIRRVNVSLDTLDRNRFKRITGHDLFDDVFEGILGALEYGLSPVKLNMVVLAGINEDELPDMAGLVFRYPLHVRFIEYMPMGNFGMKSGRFYPAAAMLARLEKLGDLSRIQRSGHDGPAERFKLRGAIGELGIIGAQTRHLCRTCNRLRVTAEGMLRPCLLSDVQSSFKAPLRSGVSHRELCALFAEAARKKPSSHCLADAIPMPVRAEMSAIGG